jgi:hypothetical protein
MTVSLLVRLRPHLIFLEYTYLGDALSDGLSAWVMVAVNTSPEYDPDYSFIYTTSECMAEPVGTTSVGSGGYAPNALLLTALCHLIPLLLALSLLEFRVITKPALQSIF